MPGARPLTLFIADAAVYIAFTPATFEQNLVKYTATIRQKNNPGIKTRQHMLKSPLTVYLGKTARTTMNSTATAKTTAVNVQLSGQIAELKKIELVTTDITNILLYSARKKKEKSIDEYSRLYPATNSASASGKSKGVLFVSASAQIKNTTNTGIKSKASIIFINTKSISLRLPLITTIIKTHSDNGIS
jgi:hypothetical protein